MLTEMHIPGVCGSYALKDIYDNITFDIRGTGLLSALSSAVLLELYVIFNVAKVTGLWILEHLLQMLAFLLHRNFLQV